MYTYDTDAAAMFDDRTHQFEKFGIPLDEIESVRAATTDMWADAPGGWVYEWSRLAEKYADRGDHYLASLTYGCAKFPCLADPARVAAMQHQLEQFEVAAKDFPLATPAGSDEEADYLGLPGLLDANQMRELLLRRQVEQLDRRSRNGAAVPEPVTRHGQLRDLRRELNALVSAAHHRTGKPHGWIHNELRRLCGGPPIAAASSEQLRARIEAVRGLTA